MRGCCALYLLVVSCFVALVFAVVSFGGFAVCCVCFDCFCLICFDCMLWLFSDDWVCFSVVSLLLILVLLMS